MYAIRSYYATESGAWARGSRIPGEAVLRSRIRSPPDLADIRVKCPSNHGVQIPESLQELRSEAAIV